MREVVGVAILDHDRVLVARRTRPPALSGLWEFPGGKVEPGELPDDAVVREVAEELGCAIEITGWLPTESLVPDGTGRGPELRLRVATGHLSGADPVPVEHDAVRWLAADQLGIVCWVEADVPFVSLVGDLLVGGRH